MNLTILILVLIYSVIWVESNNVGNGKSNGFDKDIEISYIWKYFYIIIITYGYIEI
jgi:hypothetical protein